MKCSGYPNTGHVQWVFPVFKWFSVFRTLTVCYKYYCVQIYLLVDSDKHQLNLWSQPKVTIIRKKIIYQSIVIQIRLVSSYLSFLCYQYFAYFFHYSTLLDKILIFLNFLSCVLWPFLRIHFYMQVHKLHNTFWGIFRLPPSPFIMPQYPLHYDLA